MKKPTGNGPWHLLTAILKNNKYYVDERLGQPRNTDKPHGSIDFLSLYRKLKFPIFIYNAGPVAGLSRAISGSSGGFRASSEYAMKTDGYINRSLS